MTRTHPNFKNFKAPMIPHYKGKRPPGSWNTPAPCLAPDRCFFIGVKAPKSSSPFAEVSFSFGRQEGVKINVEWAASAKTNSSTGFLDMPKEIRDMIYGHICGDLKRKGLRWAATEPHITKQPVDGDVGKTAECKIDGPQSNDLSDQEAKDTTIPPVLFADCAVMRTCHQVHAEFASVLYASPLHVSGISQGNNILPFSFTYADLVRQVVSVEKGFSYSNEVHEWRQKLQIAAGISWIFPKAQVIRLAWFVNHGNSALLTTSDAEKWKTAVEGIQAMIKIVNKLSPQGSSKIPWNLEIVQIRVVGSRWRLSTFYEEVETVSTPATEAIAGLRAKRPAKAGRA